MADAAPDKPTGKASVEKRRIPGNLPYITNYGSIKTVLDKAISAARPDRLTQDYLANVFNLQGGSFKAVLPILRRVGLIAADGTPTDLYTKFRSESGRPEAVYNALKIGFPELFRRSENVYAASEAKVTDLIAEITGLTKDDPIVKAIRGTFKIFASYLPNGFSPGEMAPAARDEPERHAEKTRVDTGSAALEAHSNAPWGLAYHINLVLPESKDPEVFNTIFKSLRDNLLRQ